VTTRARGRGAGSTTSLPAQRERESDEAFEQRQWSEVALSSSAAALVSPPLGYAWSPPAWGEEDVYLLGYISGHRTK
jgi:hypothetical protein